MNKLKQKIPLYDLKLPKASNTNVAKTLKEGWLSTGKKVVEFEKKLGQMLNVKNCVATNSATSALVAMLKAIGVEGKQVITTPFTFVATVEAICLAGGKPVLADINPETLNIDLHEVQKLITNKTAVIIPVDIAGHPCNYQVLTALAKKNNLKIVIDASHSLGATYNNKSMAQISDAAIFSFHATKNLVCGEGGLIATRNRQLAQKARLITRHGITNIASDRKRKATTSYDVVELGFKGTMSELHAAVGLGHLTQFEANQKARTKLAERYLTKLKPFSDYLKLPVTNSKATPAWHLFIIQLNLDRWKINRDQFIRELAKLGVEGGVHFIPLFEMSYYKNLRKSAKALTNASQAGQRVVTLPLYPTLKASEVDFVCSKISDLIGRFGR